MEVFNEAQGRKHVLSLSHFWPVRKPRPCAEKLPANKALTTGLRVIDAIYPSVLGIHAYMYMMMMMMMMMMIADDNDDDNDDDDMMIIMMIMMMI